jgi:hypothetical protein
MISNDFVAVALQGSDGFDFVHRSTIDIYRFRTWAPIWCDIARQIITRKWQKKKCRPQKQAASLCFNVYSG